MFPTLAPPGELLPGDMVTQGPSVLGDEDECVQPPLAAEHISGGALGLQKPSILSRPRVGEARSPSESLSSSNDDQLLSSLAPWPDPHSRAGSPKPIQPAGKGSQ